LISPDEVLAYWFGDNPDDANVPRQRADLWWGKNPATDEEIHRRFGRLHASAAAGELRDWEQSPRGRLALIVLIDQFSRNMFRGTATAFAHDALARRWSLEGIAAGHDRTLRPIERVFFYMPLQHSESLADQEHAVRLYEALLDDAPAAARESFENFLDYARRHRDIVARFGRFPHRNAILGRRSTAEEEGFLKQPGSKF
jgi:uncharacterized protein (DUF924 family)